MVFKIILTVILFITLITLMYNIIIGVRTNDGKLIDLLFEKGYKKNFRTWRYWNVSGASWLNILDDVEKKIITFSNENIKRTTDEIINEVINNFINKNDEDRFIDIDPNMNLGLVSPLEL